MHKHDLAAAVATTAALLLQSGCKKPSTEMTHTAGPIEARMIDASASDPPAFVGRMWMSMDRGQPPGSIRIFLPDKSLLMDSCFETFRIVEWGVVSADTIRWREDSIPIQAQWSQPTPDSLTLKVAGMDEAQTYVAASVPYLCPDTPK